MRWFAEDSAGIRHTHRWGAGGQKSSKVLKSRLCRKKWRSAAQLNHPIARRDVQMLRMIRGEQHLFRTISVHHLQLSDLQAKLLILLALPRGLEPLFLPVGELTRCLILPGAPALANREARARVNAVAVPNFPEPHLRASAIAEQIKRPATVGLGHVLAAPLRSRHEDY
jgi:hypothetical protein